jgi:HK97 family phage portal protein
MAGFLGKLIEKSTFGIFGANAAGGGISENNNPRFWSQDLFAGKTASGEVVTATSVLRNPAYYAAIRNISEDVGKLSMDVYKSLPGGGKEKQLDHPMQNMLNFRPNPSMSSMSFYETLTHHAINGGNGYAEIVRNGRGDIAEMHPIHPSRVTPFFKLDENGIPNLKYEISGTFKDRNGQTHHGLALEAENVIHLHGLGSDGVVGYSVYHQAAQSLGISAAAEKFSAAFYANGTTLTGVLESAGEISDEAYARLRKSWYRLHKGAKNAHGLAILEAGMSFKAISTDPEKSQLLETRKFQVLEVARLLRIPPHKIASMEAATFGNIEEQNIEYNRDTLAPWLRRWHYELTYKLLDKSKGEFAQFEINGLALGDSKSRGDFYNTLFNTGAITPNQIRDSEDLNRSTAEGMDDYFMQLNMSTVGDIAAGTAKADNQPSPQAMANLELAEEMAKAQPEAPLIDTFDEHAELFAPLFEATAQKIVKTEYNAISRSLASKAGKRPDFERWAAKFFKTQGEQIEAGFTPIIQTFISSFKDTKHTLNPDFIGDFAKNYSTEGIEKALFLFDSGEELPDNSAKEGAKMAANVVKLIGESVEKRPNDEK